MAESKQSGGGSRKSGTKKSGGGSSGTKKSGGGSSGGSGGDRSARDVVLDAVRELQTLIGRPVEAVTGIEKDGSGWTVMVEVVELERIPNTTDVLGVYEVNVDKNGELTGTRRTRRYYRSEAGDE